MTKYFLKFAAKNEGVTEKRCMIYRKKTKRKKKEKKSK